MRLQTFQKMPSPQHFLNYLHAFLSKPGVYSSAPLSLLLIGLAVLIEPKLLCPCRYERNVSLITFIFAGPACFTFTLMFALLRLQSAGKNKADDSPCATQSDDARSSAGINDANDAQSKNLGKMLLYCLIPPVIWILILLLDGDYMACGMSTWEGNYVFDEEVNIKWCQPTEQVGNKSDLRLKYQKIIWESQLSGYVLIFLPSVSIFGIVVYHDWRNNTGGAQDGTQTRTESEARSNAEKTELKPCLKKDTLNTYTWTQIKKQ